MKRIVVTLEPWRYPNSSAIELRVTAEVGGRRYEDRRVIPNDAFHSLFERLLDRAKETMKALVEDDMPDDPEAYRNERARACGGEAMTTSEPATVVVVVGGPPPAPCPFDSAPHLHRLVNGTLECVTP